MSNKRAGRPQKKWQGLLGELCYEDMTTEYLDSRFELLFEQFKIDKNSEYKWKRLCLKLVQYIGIPAFTRKYDNKEFVASLRDAYFYKTVGKFLDNNGKNLQKAIRAYVENMADEKSLKEYCEIDEDTLEKKYRRIEKRIQNKDPIIISALMIDPSKKGNCGLTLGVEKRTYKNRNKKGK